MNLKGLTQQHPRPPQSNFLDFFLTLGILNWSIKMNSNLHWQPNTVLDFIDKYKYKYNGIGFYRQIFNKVYYFPALRRRQWVM